MALQVENVLKRYEGVDVDDVSIDSCKHVAPIAESTLTCREKNLLYHVIQPVAYWLSWLVFMSVLSGSQLEG